MKKILLILLLAFIMGGCKFQDSQIRCDDIKPNENMPYFTELKTQPTGCYYGSLNQKAPGTPKGWMHYAEGKRNAAWCQFDSNKPDNAEQRDCQL